MSGRVLFFKWQFGPLTFCDLCFCFLTRSVPVISILLNSPHMLQFIALILYQGIKKGTFIKVEMLYLQEMGGGCGDWLELAQDRDRWRTLVSTVMNLRVL